MFNFRPLLLSAFLIFLTPLLFAQSLTPETAREKVMAELKTVAAEEGLQPADYAEFRMTDFYTSRQNGLTYFYLQQTHQGIPVERGTANGVFDASGKLRHFKLRFYPQLQQRLGPNTPGLDAQNALKFAAQALDITLPASPPRVLEEENDERQTTVFDEKGIALEPVETRLTWFPADEETLRLCWEVHWYETGADHRWVMFLDAQDGKVLQKYDLVLNCNFGSPDHAHSHECLGYDMRGFEQTRRTLQAVNEPNSYRVFPVPLESPNHGSSALVTDPADTIASPLGWHDVDGQPGPEYTITRGNNVHAYQDAQNNNQSVGDEPDGGPDLIFDFPYDPNDPPEEYQDAAVTNLFYWCNVVHNVWYNYGFDEEAGNFQENNFGRGGEEGDYIRAEAQDGSGTNNANFSSGADGTSARIQMYLWTSQSNSFYLEVLEPDTIAGLIQTASASFGPDIPQTPLTGEVVQAVDDSANPTQACEGVTNAAEVEGKIALIDRGNCTFVEKVANAQAAGAIAVIICNDEPGPPTTMGGVDVGIDIPSVMISQNECAVIKGFLNEGVTVKLQDDNSGTDFLDGDFDNGIIAHEYGHGLSIRMTGGPSTGSCLFNDEQMGEGWSDYAGLVLTMEEGDQGEDIRGIGTFAINQSTTGNGIRPAPYSTDFSVNPYTYGNSNNTNISQPHGVGFIWATVLWDMTWDLIDLYGFDSDFSTGEGGNNIAIRLVTEGMKLQACNPGMVDGRDAILAADELLYDGIHKCLIWEAFARRGLGFSASQGSPFDRFDQVEAFDIPTICQTPVTEPTALFSSNVETNCTGDFQFTDESTDIPQSWLWDFGDGNTSDEQNPSHTYTQEGTYEVILTVTNTLGESTYSVTVEVDFPDAPQADDQLICAGESATLMATGPGEVNWYQNGQLLSTGESFETGPLSSSQTYEMETEILAPSANVGPADNSFGTGGYHNTGFTGIIYFTAHTPLVIETVWVDAGNAGDRTIVLFDGAGSPIDQVNVFVPEGQSTVTLNLEVPTTGDYGLGGTSVNLYRNNSGAVYPYELDGMLTMTGTSAVTSPDYYYYFYDWKVREVSCFSEPATVSVEVNPAPEAGFTFEQVDENVEFTDASTGAVSWLWDFGDGNTSTEQSPSHEYAQTGDYTVTLIVDNGNCTDTLLQTVSYATVVATQDISGLQYFRLLPNPGKGLFRVQAQLENARPVSLRITNALGKVVYAREAQQVQQLDESIDLRQLPAGAYLVSLISEGQAAVRQYVLVK